MMKMFSGNAKERFFYHNTLLCLIRALEGKNITIDLRNDTYVCGNVVNVDGFMNISFINAIYCDPQENEYSFENLFVQARNIRYIHIPQTDSILTTIKNELGKHKDQGPAKKPMEKSRKAKKTLQQHMQTVASLDI